MILDGYSRLQTIRKIILPLAAPGIAVTALFTFIFVWNEFLIAFVLTRASTSTLAVFIVGLNTNFGFEWELLFATTVIQMVPMLLVVIFLQRYIARGLTFGAVK
jgi:multiple sugar transport system permease protein